MQTTLDLISFASRRMLRAARQKKRLKTINEAATEGRSSAHQRFFSTENASITRAVMLNSALSSSGNKTFRLLALAMLAIALIGFTDATYLTVKHYQGASPVCFLTSGCNTVTTSAYSVILGVPVALLGALYYSAIILGVVAYLDTKNQRLLRALSFFTIAGLLASIWFMGLQFFVIQALCIYCIVSATTSSLLFFLFI